MTEKRKKKKLRRKLYKRRNRKKNTKTNKYRKLKMKRKKFHQNLSQKLMHRYILTNIRLKKFNNLKLTRRILQKTRRTKFKLKKIFNIRTRRKLPNKYKEIEPQRLRLFKKLGIFHKKIKKKFKTSLFKLYNKNFNLKINKKPIKPILFKKITKKHLQNQNKKFVRRNLQKTQKVLSKPNKFKLHLLLKKKKIKSNKLYIFTQKMMNKKMKKLLIKKARIKKNRNTHFIHKYNSLFTLQKNPKLEIYEKKLSQLSKISKFKSKFKYRKTYTKKLLFKKLAQRIVLKMNKMGSIKPFSLNNNSHIKLNKFLIKRKVRKYKTPKRVEINSKIKEFKRPFRSFQKKSLNQPTRANKAISGFRTFKGKSKNR